MKKVRIIVEDGENWEYLGSCVAQIHLDTSSEQFHDEENERRLRLNALPEPLTGDTFDLSDANDLRRLAHRIDQYNGVTL